MSAGNRMDGWLLTSALGAERERKMNEWPRMSLVRESVANVST